MNSEILSNIKRGKRSQSNYRTDFLFFDGLYILIIGVILIALFSGTNVSVRRPQLQLAQANTGTDKIVQISPSPTPLVFIDDRAKRLNIFLNSKSSPLAPYSNLIVQEADRYDIGWTRLIGVAKIESAFGVKIPPGSHNAWGIMGKSGVRRFASWEEGIIEASRLLGENYTWNANRGIQQKYCPDSDGCNPSWAAIVSSTQAEILATPSSTQ